VRPKRRAVVHALGAVVQLGWVWYLCGGVYSECLQVFATPDAIASMSSMRVAWMGAAARPATCSRDEAWSGKGASGPEPTAGGP